MNPTRRLAESVTPDGGRLSLEELDNCFVIRLNGEPLMHSMTTTSEALLGELAVTGVSEAEAPRILIGGLGLGFTLRSVLCRVGRAARVDVAELVSDIVAWNRTILRPLNGALLSDSRVTVHQEDVFNLLARAPARSYDAVLLDIDNGPVALVQQQNARVYATGGIEMIARVLKPGGRVTIWSASRERTFERRLARAGFSVDVVPAKVHPYAKRPAYTIYVAQLQPPAPAKSVTRRAPSRRASTRG